MFYDYLVEFIAIKIQTWEGAKWFDLFPVKVWETYWCSEIHLIIFQHNINRASSDVSENVSMRRKWGWDWEREFLPGNSRKESEQNTGKYQS